MENIRDNFKVDEFKSLLVNHACVYSYGVRHAQVCGSLTKKSVTKYTMERESISFSIKHKQYYSVDIYFNFCPSKMIPKRNQAIFRLFEKDL